MCKFPITECLMKIDEVLKNKNLLPPAGKYALVGMWIKYPRFNPCDPDKPRKKENPPW